MSNVPRAKKSLGQNFLVDPNLQRKIVEAVNPQPDDTVIEIGPGTGALTRHMAGRVARLFAIEKDDALADALRAELGHVTGFTVVHGDALDADIGAFTAAPELTKVVGNIPYNITTPLVFRLLERGQRPASIVFMVQREVADRILAPPGDKDYGALSVGVQAVADAERLFQVGRSAFRPVPNVDSTVLRITPHSPARLSDQEETDLRVLTRATFSMRRKQLQKILRSASEYALDTATATRILAETGIEAEARPETLAPDRFIALARALRAHGLPLPGNRGDETSGADVADEKRFIGLVAHELRSPVAAIVGYAELLADGVFGTVDDRARDGLGRIGSAARQLRALIDGLEILMSEGEPDVEPSTLVDPIGLVRAAAGEAAVEAALRGLELKLQMPEQVAPLTTDPAMFARALDLVLGAAMKAAPTGPLTIAVTDTGDVLHVTVEGADLPPDVLAAATATVSSGSGFRIIMARRVLRALGGDLQVRRSGSTSSIVLRMLRD